MKNDSCKWSNNRIYERRKKIVKLKSRKFNKVDQAVVLIYEHPLKARAYCVHKGYDCGYCVISSFKPFWIIAEYPVWNVYEKNIEVTIQLDGLHYETTLDPCTVLQKFSKCEVKVGILQYYYHSDFTWNQILANWKVKISLHYAPEIFKMWS